MSDDKPTAYAMIPIDEYERLKESAARADEGSPIIHWDLVARALNLKGINASDVGGILMLMKHDAQRWKSVADFFELRDDKSFDAALKLWMDQSRTDKALYESTVVALEECLNNMEMVYDAVGSGKDGSIIDVIGALKADAANWKSLSLCLVDFGDFETYEGVLKFINDLLAEVKSLKADAEKWRAHIGTSADNPDGTVSLSGIGDQQKKDMELGSLVRKMPKGTSLRVYSDGWATNDYNHFFAYNKNTPEEALKAILNASGIEVE